MRNVLSSIQGAGLRGRHPFFFSLSILALGLSVQGCEKKSDLAQAPVDPLVARGRVVYQSNCTACHNSDPKRAGSLGPDVFGSSKELLEARLLRAEYPDGYAPKRQTKTMPAQPQVANDIPAIHAFLNAP